VTRGRSLGHQRGGCGCIRTKLWRITGEGYAGLLIGWNRRLWGAKHAVQPGEQCLLRFECSRELRVLLVELVFAAASRCPFLVACV
jgi:hypothetical protein